MVGMLVSTAQARGPVTRPGTSVMHYMTRNALVATEAGSNVDGWLHLQHNEQGHSSKQSLRLLVTGLETNVLYNLIGVVRDDTNAVRVGTTLEPLMNAGGRPMLPPARRVQPNAA